jgi:hypothetical protein
MVSKGATMTPFSRFAFFTMARDAGFVALATLTLMVAFSYTPALACKIGATMALIFAVALLLRARYLTEERLMRGEVWRALEPQERPAGKDGRGWARAHFEMLMLRVAKGAAGAAGLLYGCALVLALATGAPQSAPSLISPANAAIVLK